MKASIELELCCRVRVRVRVRVTDLKIDFKQLLGLVGGPEGVYFQTFRLTLKNEHVMHSNILTNYIGRTTHLHISARHQYFFRYGFPPYINKKSLYWGILENVDILCLF